MYVLLYCWKERKKNNMPSPSYESKSYKVASHCGDQVVLQFMEYERNLQRSKPMEAHKIDCRPKFQLALESWPK